MRRTLRWAMHGVMTLLVLCALLSLAAQVLLGDTLYFHGWYRRKTIFATGQLQFQSVVIMAHRDKLGVGVEWMNRGDAAFKKQAWTPWEHRNHVGLYSHISQMPPSLADLVINETVLLGRGSGDGVLLSLGVRPWLAAILLMLAPFAWFTICWRRRSASRIPGVCTACGYDLRATAGSTCPECGAAIFKKL